MTRATLVTLAWLCTASSGSTPAYAQVPPVGRAPTARLSADTVAVGDAFALEVSFDVPPGSTVYFPDTLAATAAVESLRPVAWTAAAGAEGARVTLTYELMAFREGNIPVPGLDVLIVDGARPVAGTALPGGSAVGAWSEALLDRDANVPRTRFARRGVWVLPTLTPEALAGGVEPRPPRDVAGGSWSWPIAGLGLVFSAALLGLVSSVVRDRRTDRGQPLDAATSRAAARAAALDELDRLLAEGLHRNGRTREFYERSSSAVRRYVTQVEPSCGPDLTSGEVMSRLAARAGSASIVSLEPEMAQAEVVKFGQVRPAPETAERHVRVLRDWLTGWGTRA